MKKGFTLVEILVSITLFMVVMTVAMGAVLGIFNANRKTDSMKAVMDNLNATLETMSREMRFGTKYYCGSSYYNPAAQNCPSGSTAISFLTQDNQQVGYDINSTSIVKTVNGAAHIPVTAPEVVITDLTFYVLGAMPPSTDVCDGSSDCLQPRVLIKIKGYAGTKPESRTNFTVQTTVSERHLDTLP
jgi:type II secretory pathway pseudopilin PulG